MNSEKDDHSKKINLSLDDIIRNKKKEERETKNFDKFKMKNNFKNNHYEENRGGRRNNINYNNYGNNRHHNNNYNYNQNRNDRDNNYQNNWGKSNSRRRYLNTKSKDNNCRLRVSNLHYNVMNSELQTFFSSLGDLKRCGIHWDEAGISKGTADVEYERASDALKAIEDLNGTELEGMKIKIEYY